MTDRAWDVGGQRSGRRRMGGRTWDLGGRGGWGGDNGMSAIQKIRPRPSSDKFSVSKYCLHAQNCLVSLPRQIPWSQIWIFVTMFSTQIWPSAGIMLKRKKHASSTRQGIWTLFEKELNPKCFPTKIQQNSSSSSRKKAHSCHWNCKFEFWHQLDSTLCSSTKTQYNNSN